MLCSPKTSKEARASKLWCHCSQAAALLFQKREWTPISWWGHQSSFDHGNLNQGCIYLLLALVHLSLPMLCTLLEAWYSPGLERLGYGILENKMGSGEKW